MTARERGGRRRLASQSSIGLELSRELEQPHEILG